MANPITDNDNHDDLLIPDPQVWKMFGVTSMTLHRWTRDERLGFPPPIKIRTRNYRSQSALKEWKERMVRGGVRSSPHVRLAKSL